MTVSRPALFAVHGDIVECHRGGAHALAHEAEAGGAAGPCGPRQREEDDRALVGPHVEPQVIAVEGARRLQIGRIDQNRGR